MSYLVYYDILISHILGNRHILGNMPKPNLKKSVFCFVRYYFYYKVFFQFKLKSKLKYRKSLSLGKPYYRFEFSFREIRDSEIMVEPGKKLNNCFIMSAEIHSIVQFFLNNLHALNPFSTNVPLLYPLKTSENWRLKMG